MNSSSPPKKDQLALQAVLSPCDNICRLLTPPAAAKELSVKNLIHVLPAIEESASKAVAAWERYTRHIDGGAYKSALRVAHIVLGTLTQAVQACRQVEVAVNPVDNEPTTAGGDDDLSASGDGLEALSDAQHGILAHAIALVASVNRARLSALRPAAEQLRVEVDRLRDLFDAAAVRDAAAGCSERLRATWPLQAAAAEAQRAMLLDTFKVPPSVHEVLGVAQEVGNAIRGPDAAASAALEDDDPVAAIRASFRAALAESSASEAPSPHGKGFAMLLSRPQDVPDAHDLPRAWLHARNALAAASTSPAQEADAAPVPWSSIATLRDDPGGLARGLGSPQQLLLGTVANHLHTAIGRYPANMTACYAMAVLLCDGFLFLEPFVHAVGQLPATAAPSGPAKEVPHSGRHRALLFVQPDRSARHFPDSALDNAAQIHAVLAIGVDKLLGEIGRIVNEARVGFEEPPASDDEHQTSGALLTVLCSAAQPLLMIFSKFPTAATPSLLELFVVTVGHLITRFTAEWSVLHMRGAAETAVRRDEQLFRQYFENHPTLKAGDTAEGERRRRLFDAAGWQP